jgi:hypothetical protein
MMSGAAQADCVPYPTVENGTTHCTGANGGGILLDATGATLTLDDGASVTATTTAGIVMASHSPAQGNGNDLYLTIGGNVVGGSQSGVLVQNGIVPNSAAVAATLPARRASGFRNRLEIGAV